MSHLMNTYGRLPVAFSHGEGSWLFELAGKRYLDALSGIAVSTLGHNHPRLVKAISEQVSQKIETNDTIVALATAHGSAAIAVIRLSGPNAFKVVERNFKLRSSKKNNFTIKLRIPFILGYWCRMMLLLMRFW